MKKHKYFIGVLLLILNFLSLCYGYNYHGCALVPDGNHGWVVTIDTTLILHTWDGGVNWEPQELLTSRNYFDVFFLDSLKGWTVHILAIIWHTSDGGLTWSYQNPGGSKFGTRISFFDSLFGWAACGSAIVLRTTDGGVTWPQVILNSIVPADTADFYGVSFVDSLKGWMCAGRYPELDTGGNIVFKQGQGYIVHSENGGDSWILQKRDTIYDFFDVRFKDEQEGWVVGGNDSTMEACVLHTTNGGQDWNPLLIPNTAKYLRALELIDGNKLWAVGRNGTIIYSPDGGNNWQIQSSGIDTTLFDVDFADSLNGLIAGNNVVLYTHNGGNTWLRADVPGIAQNSNDKIQNTKLLAQPNPFSRQTKIQIPKSKFPISAVESQIYDATGKLVTSLKLNPVSASSSSSLWDGRDNRGREVKPGVYFVVSEKSPNQRLRLVKVK